VGILRPLSRDFADTDSGERFGCGLGGCELTQMDPNNPTGKYRFRDRHGLAKRHAAIA
jgi:hypothetical protein